MNCQIEGCDHGAISPARGLCVKHWNRYKRHGSTDLPLRKPKPKCCTVEGCDRPTHAKTVCLQHYGRHYRTGLYEPRDGWGLAKIRQRGERGIEYNGEKLLISEWANRIGVCYNTLKYRLGKWPLEQALTSPKFIDGTKRPKDELR